MSPRTGGTAAHQETTVVNRDTGIGYRSITDPNDSSSTVWISDHGLTISSTDGLLIDADRAISVDHQRVIADWNNTVSYSDGDFVWTTNDLTNSQGSSVPNLTIHRSTANNNTDDPDGSAVDWAVISLQDQDIFSIWSEGIRQ